MLLVEKKKSKKEVSKITGNVALAHGRQTKCNNCGENVYNYKNAYKTIYIGIFC